MELTGCFLNKYNSYPNSLVRLPVQKKNLYLLKISAMENTILNKQQIEQKIVRIAHEIVENTFSHNRIFIAGISGNGMILAEKIAAIVKTVADQQIELVTITLDKEAPLSHPVKLSCPSDDLTHSVVILVDDVINSGRTMQYALMKILETPVDFIKTVTLVDRTHRRYPIRADFVGITLTTTLKDRVEVTFENEARAYLV